MTLAPERVLAVGPRVRVRPFTRQDVDAWQAWEPYADPLLAGTSARPLPPEVRARWLSDVVDRQGQVPFAIDDEHEDFIGRLFLRHVKRDEGSAVLGIDLRPDRLGQKYGTEALACFLGYFFGEMDFRLMRLSVAAFNKRAHRSYVSLGFRVTGSHWDSHTGPAIIDGPRFDSVREFLRRGAFGLEALFEDMELSRAHWRSRQALGTPSEQQAHS